MKSRFKMITDKSMGRIEIIGNIASGKTTFSKIFSDRLLVLNESFTSNPFWELFYRDSERYSFETEVTFTLQHYCQIKDGANADKFLISDFSLYLDEAYARVTLRDRKRELYLELLDMLREELAGPALVVYLRCSSSALLDRIKKRGRKIEIGITGSYIERLEESIEETLLLSGALSTSLEIDSENINFVDSSEDIKYVANLVESKLNKMKLGNI